MTADPGGPPELFLGDPNPGPTPSPELGKKFNPLEKRETMRGTIAVSLIALLALTIAASFAVLWVHPDRTKEVHDLLGLIFAPLVALVGAATGYYFGSQERS